MDGFEKGHSGAHSRLTLSRSYLQIKIGEKLSEKVRRDVFIPQGVIPFFS